MLNINVESRYSDFYWSQREGSQFFNIEYDVSCDFVVYMVIINLR